MFRARDCLEGHILLGLILSLISWICLILTSFSTPYIKSIYYLTLPESNDQIKFGNFGYCSTFDGCIGPKVGYDYSEGNNGEIIEWLTEPLIMFPFAGILMLSAWITLILSLLKVGKFMWNPIYFRTTALLGSLFAILSEIFALILFVLARQKFKDNGIRATYGASLWLGLIGAITAFLSAAIGGPAYQGKFMYRANRQQAYNV
ncbi:uncharacterized protein L201_005271 [Kwoniella dendrophila CBS 6074]|uniref:Uncharacterized protein n=1 Tax=Kwoniella dendrophila CBS 6074 TaxID=1295534 RepID=A0AAX4JZQ7_9TREE